MGRKATPFTVYEDPRTHLAWLNATVGGHRVRQSLGVPYSDSPNRRSTHHERQVAEAAAQAYAALVDGRSLAPAPDARVRTSATLHEMLSLFLVEDGKTYPASAKLSVTHMSHVEAFAALAAERADNRTPLERVTADEGPTNYALYRLRLVLKATVTKEVTTLFRFLDWAKVRGYIRTIPPRPEYPKKAIGVHAGTQRRMPVPATHEELLHVIGALPEWTSRGGRGKGTRTAHAIAVRDVARFAYETGLRPSTVARIATPDHWHPGSTVLTITSDIDKGRNPIRRVGLSSVAAAILAKHAPAEGIVFGKHDLRVQWKRAAAKVLPPGRAKDFAPYDFRHGAGRRMVEVSGGNLLGVAHMLGHSQLTTTNKYLAPAEVHGDSVVAAMNADAKRKKVRIPSAEPSAKKKAPVRAPRKSA